MPVDREHRDQDEREPERRRRVEDERDPGSDVVDRASCGGAPAGSRAGSQTTRASSTEMPASSIVFGRRSPSSSVTTFVLVVREARGCRAGWLRASSSTARAAACRGRMLLVEAAIEVFVARSPSTARAVPPGSSWSITNTITLTSSRTTIGLGEAAKDVAGQSTIAPRRGGPRATRRTAPARVLLRE